MPEIKILIVDDSRIFRRALEQCLIDLDIFEIIGSVFSGEKAVELISENQPDIIILDLEMPGMSGIETLSKINELYRLKKYNPSFDIIMVSSLTIDDAGMISRDLKNKIFDFYTKPKICPLGETMEILNGSLIKNILQLADYKKTIKPLQKKKLMRKKKKHKTVIKTKAFDAILIGVSTGGPMALTQFLPQLCHITDIPIFIVQHMPERFTITLASSLDKKCKHEVVEATNGLEVREKVVYIAPGGRHMVLKKNGTTIRTILTNKAPVNYCCPSVDMLFKSAPSVYGGNLLALVLTGMGKDGSESLSSLKEAGATIIAQDEASSVVWGMPKSAIETGYVDSILPLKGIASAIESLLMKGVYGA